MAGTAWLNATAPAKEPLSVRQLHRLFELRRALGMLHGFFFMEPFSIESLSPPFSIAPAPGSAGCAPCIGWGPAGAWAKTAPVKAGPAKKDSVPTTATAVIDLN